MKTVLALDLASQTGFAIGAVGGRPISGTVRFASAGASHEAIFADALGWMSDMCKGYEPTTIVWEAPLPTSFSRGNSNVKTTTLLYGLPAVVGAAAYLRGIYDVRKAHQGRAQSFHRIESEARRGQEIGDAAVPCDGLGRRGRQRGRRAGDMVLYVRADRSEIGNDADAAVSARAYRLPRKDIHIYFAEISAPFRVDDVNCRSGWCRVEESSACKKAL
jgi:hypothetical protein